MQLSLFTDYALRVLLALGANPGKKSSIANIAAQYRISEAHLVRVVHKLATLGWIETQRGRGGGLSFLSATRDLTVGSVVRTLEFGEGQGVVDCLKADGAPCVIDGACRLKGSLRRAQEAFLASLDGVTIASLLTNSASLRERLAGGHSFTSTVVKP